MTKKGIGYAKLDAIIELHGQDNLAEMIITRVAEGENPVSIARSLDMPYVCLKKWIEQNIADDVALAKRAHADVLVHTALDEAHNCDPDTVNVAKFRADTYLKVAGKQDRVAWGDGNIVNTGSALGNITIVIGDAKPVAIEDKNIIDAEVIDGED